ncbi:MAG: glycosyltransferase family 2 protein [Acidobacteriota bacterium]|jgi:hypothetical protein
MRIVMTLLVRDEEDIIEWNLRYHLSRGVDHFVVTDNQSVDGTVEILREYERQGVVTYVHEPDDDFSQDRWVTGMTVLAQSKLQPDWLIHSDADEFWWPESAASLDELFGSVRRWRRAVRVDRCDFLGPSRHADEPFFKRMIYRVRQPRNLLGYPLPPKVAHRPLEDPYIHQGNHRVSTGGRVLRPRRLKGISILHFPARTPDQLRNKVMRGGAAYESNTRFDETVGSTWRRMYRSQRNGELGRLIDAHFLDPKAADDRDVIEDRRLADYLAELSPVSSDRRDGPRDGDR